MNPTITNQFNQIDTILTDWENNSLIIANEEGQLFIDALIKHQGKLFKVVADIWHEIHK